jgi:hypothetical protein
MTVSNLNSFRPLISSVFETNIIFSTIFSKEICIFALNSASNHLHGIYYFKFFSEILIQMYRKWNRCNRNIKENVGFCFCADVRCSL